MHYLFTIPIRLYQFIVSPILGNNCRFAPTCSDYSLDALKTYGIFKGTFFSIKRLSKCHPWHQGGFDPLPKN